jgi:hypothetical protein
MEAAAHLPPSIGSTSSLEAEAAAAAYATLPAFTKSVGNWDTHDDSNSSSSKGVIVTCGVGSARVKEST